MATIKMKRSEAKEITRKAIGLAIVKNRDKIVALLKKYGVAIDSSYSDDELIVATLVGIRSNTKFKDDLGKLLTETTSESIGFTAEYNSFFFTGSESFFGWDGETGTASSTTTTTTTKPKEKTAIGSLLSDKNTLSNILNTGLSVFSTSLTNKSNQKLADTALQIEAEKTKQAALLAQRAGAGGGAGGANTGLSTGAKIGIGIGVAAVVGLIIYLVVKK